MFFVGDLIRIKDLDPDHMMSGQAALIVEELGEQNDLVAGNLYYRVQLSRRQTFHIVDEEEIEIISEGKKLHPTLS